MKSSEISALFDACVEYGVHGICRPDRQYERKANQIETAWAMYYGLTPAGGDTSWGRLFGKLNIRRSWDMNLDYPPYTDHASLWRIKGQQPRFAQVFVSQPYGIALEEMKAFAAEKNLWFWVSRRPAWHYPGVVKFVEWSAPGSDFARKRSTAEAHQLWETVVEWTPGGESHGQLFQTVAVPH
jgi:hypothetical protein